LQFEAEAVREAFGTEYALAFCQAEDEWHFARLRMSGGR
jgi:hypothetical protein